MIEVLKQALEALKDVGVLTDREWQAVHKNKANELRQAIAELESQEPVALPCCGYTDASAVKWNPLNGFVQCHNCGQNYTATPQRTEERNFCPRCGKRLGGIDSIHTCTPPQEQQSCDKRTWVGLTDDEIEKVWQNVETSDFEDCVQPFAQAIEAKLKEKNT
jgi:transcription initiation factor IIE alpha subunit